MAIGVVHVVLRAVDDGARLNLFEQIPFSPVIVAQVHEVVDDLGAVVWAGEVALLTVPPRAIVRCIKRGRHGRNSNLRLHRPMKTGADKSYSLEAKAGGYS